MGFPGNVVTVIKEQAPRLGETVTADDVELLVMGRPLRIEDPNFSFGAFSLDWKPNGAEIGQRAPAITRYDYMIQILCRGSDEEYMREIHGDLTKSLRALLYQDEEVKVALTQLSDSQFGLKERVQQWGVPQQRFFANEMSGTFVYLSATSLWVEVETVPV